MWLYSMQFPNTKSKNPESETETQMSIIESNRLSSKLERHAVKRCSCAKHDMTRINPGNAKPNPPSLTPKDKQ